ncbi:rna polymerase sigma-70 [Trichococcus palustris]|uniref:Rna polymerase sigma-70 n=1 Tax=Trichococcus palustris TaxID=140314 RepID=A0A143Z248_9LACT|nr:FliA/WhiG family RNA polymerase sigma factor [Trichococcus palustris]CZR02458.1 rna polymerase sigma-70 [Trichococcus palustris]SFL13247.1 RNA polymerase sigma factor for flagellar operon FliA [Trichococcus palustris]
MQNADDREQAILKYLPLVEKVVGHINIKSPEYERSDLVSIGVIGLMDALGKYDETKLASFESYAYVRIKGSIIDEVRKNAPVSRTGMTKLKNYHLAVEKLEAGLKRTPTEDEICSELQITPRQLGQIYDTASYLSTQSLEKVIFSEDGTGVELIDILEDTKMLTAEEALLEKEQLQFLTQAIAQLNEREQTILQLYYVEKLPLKEIAYIFDISVPRVSQIHGKTILKLKECIGRNNF